MFVFLRFENLSGQDDAKGALGALKYMLLDYVELGEFMSRFNLRLSFGLSFDG
jgi:hypothetical protein